jgi:hypothetical protein
MVGVILKIAKFRDRDPPPNPRSLIEGSDNSETWSL